MNIGEKCGFIKKTINLLKNEGKEKEAALSFISKVGHLFR
jgi:hypothetical protein